MFTTARLVTAAYFESHGHPVTATRPDGDKCIFEFAIDPAEATALLDHPHYVVCADYQRSLRHVRKLIDLSLYSAGLRS
jgi:hypothetical protein